MVPKWDIRVFELLFSLITHKLGFSLPNNTHPKSHSNTQEKQLEPRNWRLIKISNQLSVNCTGNRKKSLFLWNWSKFNWNTSGLLCVANGHSLSKAQDIHKLIKAIIYSTHCKILPTALEIIYQLFPINKGVCWSNKYKYPSLPMDLIWRYRSLISSFLVGIIVGPPVSIDWWYDMHKEKTFLTSIL